MCSSWTGVENSNHKWGTSVADEDAAQGFRLKPEAGCLPSDFKLIHKAVTNNDAPPCDVRNPQSLNSLRRRNNARNVGPLNWPIIAPVLSE